MKIGIFLILITVIQSFAVESYSQSALINLNMKQATIEDVLTQIENQSEFYFLYSPKIINIKKEVSIQVRDKTIEEILSELFTGSDVKYMIIDRQIVLSSELPVNAFRQQPRTREITGTIVDSKGETMTGVTIIVKGTTIGTITDINGNYSLIIPEDAKTLVFSFVGMKTHEINIEGKAIVNVIMEADLIGIEEVVAIGYGTMKRRDLIGSVSSIQGEALSEFPNATVTHALQGRTAGVVIQQTSGAPGSTPQIRIRGNISIKGSNDPLWVIDGFPVENANLLNITDIESIDVLKDASATAIYGSRGSNGVIIVTTKKARAGKTKVIYDGSFSVQTLRKKLDVLNAEEYMVFTNIQQLNDFGSAYFTQSDIDNAGDGTDWQDLIFQTALVQNHSLNISGGDQKTRYSLGGSYFNQEGIVKNTGYSRITMRSNIDHDINKWINVTMNTILSRVDNNVKDPEGSMRGGNFLHSAFAAPPSLAPYNDDGTYRQFYMDYPFINAGHVNPVAWVNEMSAKWYRNKAMSNLTLTLTPVKGLSVKSSLNVHNTEYRWDRYYSKKYPTIDGSAGIESRNILELTTNNIVTYHKSVEGHDFSIMAGSTYEQFRNTPFSVTGDGFIHDILENYDIGSATIIGIPSSSFSEWKILSFLGRINYSYKGKYLATVNFRTDGSSRYSEGNKWGYFPSGALAWRISDEDFMQQLSFISNMKFRFGYGITGSTAISPYSTVNLLTSESAVLDKQLIPGFDPRDTYPGDLKWETTEQTNVGLDLGLLKNRVQLVADYYVKNTRDLLNDVQLPSSSGYNSTIKNIGRIQNKGLEFQLDAFVLDKSLIWKISSNISFNRNKVVKLYDGQDITGTWYSLAWVGDYINLVREGEPLGVFYGYLEDGYDDNGRIKFKEVDGEIQRTIIGDPNPDFVYSFNSNLSYKNFTLSIFLQGVQGNDIFSFSVGTANCDYGFGLNPLSEVLYDHWTPQNTDAKYPAISMTNSYRVSDRFLYDGSYLRLKNVELAYSIPTNNIGVQWFNKAQIYVSGQDLLMFTKYPWYDPDVNTRGGSTSINQGIDHFSYPTTKGIMFGMRLEF